MNELMYYKGFRAGCAGDWETVEDAAKCDAETAAELLHMLDWKMPPDMKYRIACYHYSHHGDEFPVIRRCLRENKQYRPANWRDELPEAVRDNEVFTVYRASSQSIEKVRYSMSWTLSRDVAEWFANRNDFYGRPAQHIYRATITADGVIAYLDGRSEFEIVQYRRVKNITELSREGISDEYKEICKINEHFTWETYQKERAVKLEYVNRKLKEAQVNIKAV